MEIETNTGSDSEGVAVILGLELPGDSFYILIAGFIASLGLFLLLFLLRALFPFIPIFIPFVIPPIPSFLAFFYLKHFVVKRPVNFTFDSFQLLTGSNSFSPRHDRHPVHPFSNE